MVALKIGQLLDKHRVQPCAGVDNLERLSFFMASLSLMKGEIMLGTIGKIAGGLVVIVIIAGVGLNEIKGIPDTELVNRNTIAKATLEKKADEYAKCDHSLKLGSVKVSDVSLSYLKWDSTDEEKQAIKATEAKFMAQVHATCDPVIKEYTDSLATYKQTSRDIAKVQASLFDKLISKDISIPDDEFSAYDPSYVSMTRGTTEDIFTDENIASFFKESFER